MDNGKSGERMRREYSQLGGLIRMLSVSLDPKSVRELEEFVKSTSVVRLRREVKEYLSEQDDLPSPWMREGQLDICLIDFDRDRTRATFTAEKVHVHLPATTIFAVSADSQPDFIIQAMRCGCSEYLLKPMAREPLLEAIARVASRSKESQPNGQILTFVGSKGGVGTTSTAAHLGTVLSRSMSRRALVVDLHPVFGDAELYLGMLKYQYSFRELLENTHRLDADLLQSFVLRHNSGLELLAAPGHWEARKPAGPEALGITIEFLRTQYEFVLIDCPPGLGDENLEAMQRSDQVYVIAVPEVVALRDVARYLEYFTRQNYPAEKIRVVLNRCSKRDTITDEQIEQAIHAPVFRKLPNQYHEVVRNINSGDPSASSSSSDLTRSLREWAASVAKGSGAKVDARKGSKGLLTFLGS